VAAKRKDGEKGGKDFVCPYLNENWRQGQGKPEEIVWLSKGKLRRKAVTFRVAQAGVVLKEIDDGCEGSYETLAGGEADTVLRG